MSHPAADNTSTAARPLFSARDLVRALCILALAASLGLILNTQKKHPVPVLDAAGPGALPDRAPRIAAKELQGMSRTTAMLIDIREDEAARKGRPKGSFHAPMSRFIETLTEQDLIPRMNAADIVVLVCESADCPLADRAYKLLEPLKLANLRVLDGGWESYEKQGLPVENDVPAHQPVQTPAKEAPK